ncbi:hypothetical protein ACLMJK_005481 [Lecanora helva]
MDTGSFETCMPWYGALYQGKYAEPGYTEESIILSTTDEDSRSRHTSNFMELGDLGSLVNGCNGQVCGQVWGGIHRCCQPPPERHDKTHDSGNIHGARFGLYGSLKLVNLTKEEEFPTNFEQQNFPGSNRRRAKHGMQQQQDVSVSTSYAASKIKVMDPIHDTIPEDQAPKIKILIHQRDGEELLMDF